MIETAHMEVSRKNAGAVLDTLGRQDVRIQEQQQRIDSLVAAVASLHGKVTALEQVVGVQRVKLMGHGPTV